MCEPRTPMARNVAGRSRPRARNLSYRLSREVGFSGVGAGIRQGLRAMGARRRYFVRHQPYGVGRVPCTEHSGLHHYLSMIVSSEIQEGVGPASTAVILDQGHNVSHTLGTFTNNLTFRLHTLPHHGKGCLVFSGLAPPVRIQRCQFNPNQHTSSPSEQTRIRDSIGTLAHGIFVTGRLETSNTSPVHPSYR